MNKYALSFEPQVKIDLQNAYDYYSNVADTKLADRFLENTNNAFDSLEINPFYEVRYKNIRAIPVNNFPFIIFFTINKNNATVDVLSIFNTNLNPKNYP